MLGPSERIIEVLENIQRERARRKRELKSAEEWEGPTPWTTTWREPCEDRPPAPQHELKTIGGKSSGSDRLPRERL